MIFIFRQERKQLLQLYPDLISSKIVKTMITVKLIHLLSKEREEVGRQKTEVRRQKTEVRRKKTEAFKAVL